MAALDEFNEPKRSLDRCGDHVNAVRRVRPPSNVERREASNPFPSISPPHVALLAIVRTYVQYRDPWQWPATGSSASASAAPRIPHTVDPRRSRRHPATPVVGGYRHMRHARPVEIARGASGPLSFYMRKYLLSAAAAPALSPDVHMNPRP